VFKKKKTCFFWFWLGVILLTVFCLSFHTLEVEWNQDLGRHIRLGEIILEEKSIPNTNLFSYQEADFPFLNHHWLSEVVFALIYNGFGNNGLILLKTFLIVLVWGVIFWLVSQKIPPPWAAFLSILPMLVFRERIYARPEFFGFLFFGLFLLIFTKAREGKINLLWWLPILQLAWVNFHISFIFGLFLIGVNLIWFLKERAFKLKKAIKKTLLPLTLAILANLINHNFIKGALAPFLIWQNYGYQIVENQSIFFLADFGYRASIIFFKIGFVFGLLFIFNKKRLIDFLAWLVLSIVSAWQIRHFPFWAIYSFWFWGDNFEFFLKKIPSKMKQYFDWGTRTVSLLIALFLIFVYSTSLIYRWSDSNRSFGFGGDQPAQEAARFLIKNFPKKKIFNNFDIGSYLDYFYPDIRVFVDSRPEAYPQEFWQEYKKVQSDWDYWQKLEKKHNMEVVFVSHADQTYWAKTFLVNLYQDKRWRLVYLDENVVIFTSLEDGPEELVIDKHLIDNSDTCSLGFVKLALFFRLVGEKDLYRLSLEKSLKSNPHSYLANSSLAQIYFQTKNPALHFKAEGLIDKINNWWYWL
jgi:hypothetical protein